MKIRDEPSVLHIADETVTDLLNGNVVNARAEVGMSFTQIDSQLIGLLTHLN